MNIYQARNLQKKLYRDSNAPVKKARIHINESGFYYLIFHLISLDRSILITEPLLQRCTQDLSRKIKITFEYIPIDNSEDLPVGVYAVELIPVD